MYVFVTRDAFFGDNFYKLERIKNNEPKPNKYAFCEIENTLHWANGSFNDPQAALDSVIKKDQELHKFTSLNDFIFFMSNELKDNFFTNDVTEHLKHLEELSLVLLQHDINMSQFIKFARIEEFTIDEINDLEYINDKCSIWREHLEDEIVSSDITQCLIDSKIPMVARYIMRNNLSVSELAYEEELKWSSEIDKVDLDKKFLEVSDHILGIVQEFGEYKE